MHNYIMKLKPVLKELIWGGNKLHDEFKIQSDLKNIAEDWVLTCHKNGKSIIENGEFASKTLEEVLAKNYEALVGTNGAKFPYFPILIKLIDAKDDLSIQVHPANEYALKNEGEFGKTEMWYVVDCDENASLIYGFKNKITSDEFRSAIKNNTLLDVLNRVKVKKGDVFFIDAGTVHAIGKGVLIAEIQQNSDTTYRVFDYNRIGVDKKPRELHIEKAVDVSVCEPPIKAIAPQGETKHMQSYSSTLLTKCDLFTVTAFDVDTQLCVKADLSSFMHILILDGDGKIDDMEFKKGDSFFVPACHEDFNINGKCSFLLTNI